MKEEKIFYKIIDDICREKEINKLYFHMVG